MGAWGSSLYESDTACDIRDDYVDKLKRGKSNEEITSKLIIEYVEGESDVEEIALFWFALANIQWDYGRLLPMVKEKHCFSLVKKKKYLFVGRRKSI